MVTSLLLCVSFLHVNACKYIIETKGKSFSEIDKEMKVF